MALDQEKNYVYQIKYHWKVEFYLKGSNKKIQPKSLKSIQKIMDYEKNFFPIFKLDVQIEDKYFDLIFKNQTQLMCQVSLSKKYYNPLDDADDSDDSKPINQELVFNDTFIAFWDKLPSSIMDSNDEATEENIEDPNFTHSEKSNVGSISITSVTVTLWHLNSLRSYKTIFNKIFEDCNVGTGIGYIISNSELISKAIVDIPDNTLKYQELVLLPYGLRNSFYNLQLRYGIYANGLWVFLDNGVLYCLKAYSVNHQHEKDQSPFTRIQLYQTPNSMKYPFLSGINKEDKSFLYETSGYLKRENIDLIMGEIYGDSLVYTNFDTIMNCVEGNGSNEKIKQPVKALERKRISHVETGVKLDLEYDELNNPFNLMSKMREQLLNVVLPITVRGVDLDAFTPEKMVELEIMDDLGKQKEYGGKYCIRNVIYVFAPEKNVENRFETTCVAQLTLSKVPDDITSN